ncbi:unnamed protein product, partial [Amoebophrya sp. A25]
FSSTSIFPPGVSLEQFDSLLLTRLLCDARQQNLSNGDNSTIGGNYNCDSTQFVQGVAHSYRTSSTKY